MNSKKILKSTLLVLTFILLIFPFILTFNDVLTQFVLKFELYRLVENKIIPVEIQFIGLIVRLFGIDFIAGQDKMITNGAEIRLIWSCLGWQSLLLFIGSAIIGFMGRRYTLLSKLEVLALGIFGIFWINILRMSFIVLLNVYSKPLFSWLYHDYLAAFVTIIYLFLLWWFAYSFVLEETTERPEHEAIKTD